MAQTREPAMNAQRKLLRLAKGIAIIMLVAIPFVPVMSHVYWQIHEVHDAPVFLGYLIFGLLWLCLQPGIIVPYAALSWSRLPANAPGVRSAFIAGIFYSAYLTVLAAALDFKWDKWVETLEGWMLLAAMTLVPGTIVAFLSLLCEVRKAAAISPPRL